MVFEDPYESQILNNVIPDLEVRDLLYDQVSSKRTNFNKNSNGEYTLQNNVLVEDNRKHYLLSCK